MTSSSTDREKGSALVEASLALPLYVLTLVALLSFGSVHLVNLRIIGAVAQLANRPGEQTLEDLPPNLFNPPAAGFEAWSQEPFLADHGLSTLYEEQFLREVINEASFYVTASYTLDGDQLVLTTSVTVTEEGRLVEKYDLMSLTEGLNTELGRWAERTSTQLQWGLGLPSMLSEDGSVIDIRVEHEHRDLIRKWEDPDQPWTRVKRLNQNEWGANPGGDRTRSMDLLPPHEVDLPAPSSTWSSFWQSMEPIE